ncbi:MAG: hypothetical protein WCP17_03810 [bacterium]
MSEKTFGDNIENSRNATKITLNKVSSWEELNAATTEEGNKKFNEKTRELWRDFVVSGTLQFDPKEGRQVLRPFTDLDGKSAIGILDASGIDTSNLEYIRPGEFLEGAINLDTGDKFGVVYEEPTYTAFFDHHAPGTKEVTSTAEIVYKTMVDLGMLEKSEAMDRLVKFVTDIDNRRLPASEFLKSGKTVLGVQRDLNFKKMLEYFKDHESPTDELTPEEFEKYGLRESAERQQKIVDESMAALERMEKEGKVVQTKYGSIVINENNELKTGSSAAYIIHDGIINFTSGKSFAVTLKEKDFDEQELRQRLGDKFQGKIIRGKMWIYNDKEPLMVTLDNIINALEPERTENQNKLKLKLYHGTLKEFNIENLKPNSDSDVLDQALGVHYSVDRSIAKWFGGENSGKGKIIENNLELDPNEILDVPDDKSKYDADNIKQLVIKTLGIKHDTPPQEIAIRFREWAKKHGIKALRYQNTQNEEIYDADDCTCYILLD